MAYTFSGPFAKDQKPFFEETKVIYYADELGDQQNIFKDKPFWVIVGDYKEIDHPGTFTSLRKDKVGRYHTEVWNIDFTYHGFDERGEYELDGDKQYVAETDGIKLRIAFDPIPVGGKGRKSKRKGKRKGKGRTRHKKR